MQPIKIGKLLKKGIGIAAAAPKVPRIIKASNDLVFSYPPNLVINMEPQAAPITGPVTAMMAYVGNTTTGSYSITFNK